MTVPAFSLVCLPPALTLPVYFSHDELEGLSKTDPTKQPPTPELKLLNGSWMLTFFNLAFKTFSNLNPPPPQPLPDFSLPSMNHLKFSECSHALFT